MTTEPGISPDFAAIELDGDAVNVLVIRNGALAEAVKLSRETSDALRPHVLNLTSHGIRWMTIFAERRLDPPAPSASVPA